MTGPTNWQSEAVRRVELGDHAAAFEAICHAVLLKPEDPHAVSDAFSISFRAETTPELVGRLRGWTLCVNPIFLHGLRHWIDRAAANSGRAEALLGLKRLFVVSAGRGSDIHRGGVLLLDLGRHTEAIRWLARALVALPGRRDTRFSLAQAMFLASLLEPALSILDAGTAQDRAIPRWQFWRARVLMGLGRYDEVDGVLDLIKDDPDVGPMCPILAATARAADFWMDPEQIKI